ncbi:MAG: amidase domain-containing protein [Bacilli bacterium]
MERKKRRIEQLHREYADYLVHSFEITKGFCPKEILLLKQMCDERNIAIVKVKYFVQPIVEHSSEDAVFIKRSYALLLEKNGKVYTEHRSEQRVLRLNNTMIQDELAPYSVLSSKLRMPSSPFNKGSVASRETAVQYAEFYWDDCNSGYPYFENNCTNYISQCLFAGGFLMSGWGNKQTGWWCNGKDTSLAWSTAHSLRWKMGKDKDKISAVEVKNAVELQYGDLIFYDFNGDGRFDHVTIVVAKDGNGEPLINANTTNSRKRYWDYSDSTAYTDDIKYKFFHILY